VLFGSTKTDGRIKRFLRKLFSPRLGYNGSAASTPNPEPPPPGDPYTTSGP
jgi:hypothetical protein